MRDIYVAVSYIEVMAVTRKFHKKVELLAFLCTEIIDFLYIVFCTRKSMGM